MPEDRRSADVNLRDMAGKPEADAVSWWSARLSQVASIPSPTARAGALIPMMRELAADQLAPDQLDKILEARSVASRQAPEIEADDRAVVGEVVSTLPAEQVERMRQAAERAGIPLPAQPSSAERR